MNPKYVARALADAMLYGESELLAVEVRCAAALGSKPRWLRGLVMAMLGRFDRRWSPRVGHALTEAILEHGSLLRALHKGEIFIVRRYFVLPASMAPRPRALECCAVPDLSTIGDLAHWLNITPDELEWFTRNRLAVHSEHYVYRWLQKRAGGWRLLEMPKVRLREMQRHVLHALLDYLPTHEAAHGFRARHSIVTNAQVHVGQRVVLRMDLQDFFLTVHSARTAALFRTLGYPDAVSRCLTALCTNRVPATVLSNREHSPQFGAAPEVDWHTQRHYRTSHLPQGAPTSPALANLCAFNFDIRVQAMADQFGANYTRYADDLSFSGDATFLRSIERFIPHIGAIAMEEGLRVNFRKTKVTTSARCQKITGVVVNRHVNLSRVSYDKLKANLHNCVLHGPRSQNRDAIIDYRAHLTGRVAHAAQLNALRAERLRGLLDQIDWEK